MHFFCRGETSQKDPTQTGPFAALIDQLRQDGLIDEASRLNVHLRETAWTTSTEFLGVFGLEMKKMRKSVRRLASAETKATFRATARIVRKTWPLLFWF